MKIGNSLVGILIISLLLIPITGAFDNISINEKDLLKFNEESKGLYGEKLEKIDIKYTPFIDHSVINKLAIDTQITFSEFDESHPSVDIDSDGNPFLMYHSEENFFNSKIFLQRTLDLGENWPEDLIWFYEFDDAIPINPDIDFVDGVRAYGTYETTEQEPRLYFFDFIDVDDPESWTLWSFDRSNYASYVSETAITANKSGRIAMASIQDYEGDDYYEDTILITWDANNFDDETADGGVYWLNNDNQGISIPYSHLCADAGDKIWFVFQRNPFDSKSQIASAVCRIDENTVYSDWSQRSVSASSGYNSSFPDVSVSGKKAFVAYMSDENGNQDIYAASSTTGSYWNRYKVTDSSDDEMYPVISADGSDIKILFMKNGDIHVTSSEDSGKTWSNPEQVNDDSNTVVEAFQNSAIKSNYGFWTDNRNENNDIYFESVGSAPILIIDEIKGGFGIQITLSNVGNAPAENIGWSIDLDGGLILAGSHFEDITNIAEGESISVKTGFIFGLGRTDITCKFGDAEKTASGLVIGPFVLDVK